MQKPMFLRSAFFLSSLITKNRSRFTTEVSFRGVRYTSSIITRNMSSEPVSNNPIESGMREKLNSILKPDYLKIINESHRHNVPRGSETHFKVVIVSDKFENISLLDRHRMVIDLLKEEIDKGIYSFTLLAKTPEQWSEDQRVPLSPKCLGGKK